MRSYKPRLLFNEFFNENFLKPGATVVKFIYSEKATKFCEISTLLLTGITYLGQKPSALDSEAIEPLSVLHSKSKFEW